MYGYIYITINQINGKIYVGKHKSEVFDENYYGSGIALKSAMNKYGKDNFFTFMLRSAETLEELNELEKICIKELHAQDNQVGYNIASGGDGGNSYVDYMTEEEKRKHWEKHIALRKGKNNHVYGKHLYHLGDEQKFLSDEEISEYEALGWIKGANDYVKAKAKERMLGENNPFYGKKHTPETLKQIQESKEKRKKHFMYHKGDVCKCILGSEIKEYEKDGWERGMPKKQGEIISQWRKNHPRSQEEIKISSAKYAKHYMYNNQEFIGMLDLINYLRQHGYLKICKHAIYKIINGEQLKRYPELTGQITRKETDSYES